MRALVIAAVVCICAVRAIASESAPEAKGGARSIEQKKAEILQHIQERIANSQAEMTCVKAAASHEEFKACHEKYRPSPQKNDKRPNPPKE